jgi:DMSO/TMAO reductase YedYZ heme-binding membrane subunit
MTAVVAATKGSALWYLARGSGIVSLVFLTASMLAGILTSFRWSSAGWPRFVVEFVHRNVSLLVVAFIALHVVTIVADGFAPISLLDAVIPFRTPYRPIWLGLGAIAFDLVVAIVATSLVRHRMGYRSWRVVHWFSYACWPLAVVHGLGSGTDSRIGVVAVLTGACVVVVLGAAAARLATGLAAKPGARTAGLLGLAVLPVVLAVWAANGPLASGWARKAGTPDDLLQGRTTSSQSASSPSTTGSTITGFSANFAGSLRTSSVDARGGVTWTLAGTMSGSASGPIEIDLRGTAVGQGIRVDDGSITVTVDGVTYRGTAGDVRGAELVTTLTGGHGSALTADLQFTRLDTTGGQMAGTIDARPTR